MSRRETRGVYEAPPDSGIWRIDYYDAEGRRHRERIGSKKLAMARYHTIKAEIWEGRYRPKAREAKVTFKELAELRMTAKKVNLAKRTIVSIESRQAKLLEAFGSTPAALITPERIQIFLGEQADAGLLAASINNFRMLLNSIFAHGVEIGKIPSNPVKKVKKLRVPPSRIRFLDAGEEETIRQRLRKKWPIGESELELFLHTGMRRAEYWDLTWQNVDLERLQVTVYGKGGYRRFVPINSVARAAFEKLYVASRGSAFVSSCRPTAAERDTTCRLAYWIREAGIENFHPYHDLRHTFASRLVMAGVDLRSVQELLGHRSILMTMRYAHLSPDHQKANIEKLVAALPAPVQTIGGNKDGLVRVAKNSRRASR